MSTSPVSPQDLRAAAAAHQELGPEYSDAAVAAFLARVDRAVDARVAARLQAMTPARRPAAGSRHALVKGIAIGACGGALATALAFTALAGGSPFAAPRSASAPVVHAQLLPFRTFHGPHGQLIRPPFQGTRRG